MLEVFKAPYGHLIPQIFLLSFLARLLFASVGITTSGSCDVKQLPLIVSIKEKAVENKIEFRS